MISNLPKLIDGLNEAQRAAVQHGDGPALVVAGAGSGKTRVVTLRIARLIAQDRVDPESILAVTFTNKAAKEMADRIYDLIGQGPGSLVTVTTFHAFCVRVLREHIERPGYRKNFTIAGEGDSRTLIRRVLGDIEGPSDTFSADAVRGYISEWKGLPADESLVIESAEDQEQEATRDKYRQWIPEIYDRYQSALRASNSVDFDDLIRLTLELWTAHPEVLDHYRQRFRYLLVDEYQDTNQTQHQLIRMLCGSAGNLMAVGDDDQSIYAWRGADVRNILNFERDFDAASVYTLDVNYRCTGRVLEAANAVIATNSRRRPKKLRAAKDAGRHLDTFTAVDADDEARQAIDWLENIRRQTGAAFRHFAFLYRSNLQSRPFEFTLRQAGIPYEVHGGQSFFERAEIQDIAAYLRLIVNPFDEAAFLRVVNVPRRGIGDATLQTIHTIARNQKVSFGKAMATALRDNDVSGPPANGLRTFLGLMKTHRSRFARREARLDELLRELVADIRYREEVDRLSRTPEAAALRWENVDALVSAAAEYEAREELPSLRGFLDDAALDTGGADRKQTSDRDAVNLMTVHSAKGLEFPFVFIVGAEEGFFPHGRSTENAEGIEEERRLFYVALTRAQRHVTIFEATERSRGDHIRQCTSSRFLQEIPPAVMRKQSHAPPKREKSA